MTRRPFRAALVAAAATLAVLPLVLAAPASADAGGTPNDNAAAAADTVGVPNPDNPAGPLLGVVPVRGQAGSTGGSGGNLSYHNGPTMSVNNVYAIYWAAGGAMDPSYRTVIDQYFNDVAAATASLKTDNVYWANTQYYGLNKSPIVNTSKLLGSEWDLNPLPASGCKLYTGVTACLSDQQLRDEINRVATKNGWPRDGSTLYFIFTAQGVGSCSGSSCAFSTFCAYHSWITVGGTLLYANMPYANTAPTGCGVAQSPNAVLNKDADATLNVTSHEHNEAITDPQGTGWYDRRGYENGDKCAWNFGAVLDSTVPAGKQFNQSIGSGKYYLQQEWSNKSSKCVLTGQ